MNIFETVRAVILEDSTLKSLPSFLHASVELFYDAHRCHRAFRQFRLFTKGSNNSSEGCSAAIYGAAMHLAGTYTTIGSYAVKIALVTKCAEDLLREYRQLSQSYQELKQAIRCQYPVYQPVTWKPTLTDVTTWIPPSLSLWWSVNIVKFMHQQLKIKQCAFKVLWQTFKLSMCLADASLLFKGDRHMHYEACTELIGEWSSYRKQIKDDCQRLLEGLRSRDCLANQILTRLKSTETISGIISTLEENVGSLSEVATGVVEDMYEAAQGTLETVCIPGKITPLHMSFTEGETFVPALPKGPFPPWAGQQLDSEDTASSQEDVAPKPTEDQPSTEPSFSLLASAIGGVTEINQQIDQLCQNCEIEQ